jgi:hypothetical protein
MTTTTALRRLAGIILCVIAALVLSLGQARIATAATSPVRYLAGASYGADPAIDVMASAMATPTPTPSYAHVVVVPYGWTYAAALFVSQQPEPGWAVGFDTDGTESVVYMVNLDNPDA